jgi:hypothetical protein
MHRHHVIMHEQNIVNNVDQGYSSRRGAVSDDISNTRQAILNVARSVSFEEVDAENMQQSADLQGRCTTKY